MESLIAAAVGMTMVHQNLSYDDAERFLLRLSEHRARRLPDLARDIVSTGKMETFNPLLLRFAHDKETR